VCDTTQSFVWYDSLICVTLLAHMCDITHLCVWHDSLTWKKKWLTHTCDFTNSYVWHDSLAYVAWPTRMCDMTHSYVWHDTLICVTLTRCRMTATTNRLSNINTIQPETSHQWNIKSLLLFTPPYGVYFYNDELSPQLQNLNKDMNSPLFSMGTVALYRDCSTGLS